ncbi:MAG: hypothetical protein IT347_09920 [Candidatus Eisenbacteria bacterium]|nr:hypothetical protein [Candidatus Eisenbacteria bacterium]
MMPTAWKRARSLAISLIVFGLLSSAGCAPRRPVVTTRAWVAGCAEPVFDPDGPPHAVRWAMERLLSRGLVELDSTGRARPAAAESVSVSADGRTWSFRLREGLRFTDGSPATSEDFRVALLAGLPREDHGSRAWLLAAVTGVDRVRAGRTLPALGVEAPDPRTLVLRLSAPDSLLPLKLALPGVATPWKRRTGIAWSEAVGLGPYRVVDESDGRSLLLARAADCVVADAAADTLRVRFVLGAPRVRTLLRAGAADLAWPLPPTFLEQAVPEGYVIGSSPAAPARRLLLVLRDDVPPTTRTAARQALAHALNRGTLLEALRGRARAEPGWVPGAGPFDFPRLDAGESRAWLARGKLGASLHVTLAFDADLAGAEVARSLQGEWARQGFYASLRGQRGEPALEEPLRAAAAQAQLVESQALVPGAVGLLAGLVMPPRGPAVGSFRTGWRTREFDPWLLPGHRAGPLDAAGLQARLVEERNVLPLAELPWLWAARHGAATVRVSARFGPEFASALPLAAAAQGSR